MLLHIGVPEAVLLVHHCLVHADLVPEQRYDARGKILDDILLQRVVELGIVDVHKLPEAGIMHRGGAVDHRIVVVHHKAAVFHSVLRFDRFFMLLLYMKQEK